MIENMWGVMQLCFKLILLASCCLILNRCSKNIFSSTAEEKSDTYRIDRARKEIDEEDYDTALEYIVPVWEKYSTDSEIGYITSVAYAGRAGLSVIDLFDQLGSDLSSKSVVEIFAEHFPNANSDDVTDMESAISVLETVGSRGANRNSKLNFLALIEYWARIGVNLHYYAYSASTTKRSSFNACKIGVDFSAGATGLPDAIIDRIMTTVPRILDTAAYVSGSGSDFDAITAASLPSISIFDPLPCSANSNHVSCLAVRSMINLGKSTTPSGIGLGTGATCVATIP
jgi:hypothetical protein